MGLNIKNVEVERLAAESKLQAILATLEGRMRQVAPWPVSNEERFASTLAWLENDVWPHIKPEFRGKPVTNRRDGRPLGVASKK